MLYPILFFAVLEKQSWCLSRSLQKSFFIFFLRLRNGFPSILNKAVVPCWQRVELCSYTIVGENKFDAIIKRQNRYFILYKMFFFNPTYCIQLTLIDLIQSYFINENNYYSKVSSLTCICNMTFLYITKTFL